MRVPQTKMMFSRIRYYLSSIPTLLLGIDNWLACVRLPFRSEPLILRLRNGLRFKVRTLLDVWIIKETCLDRDYEKNGATIEDSWNVIDIGAAAGDFAILTASEHPNARILAFEPSPHSITLLMENLALNDVYNVEVFPHAVASKNGIVNLEIGKSPVQHSTTQTISGQRVRVRALAFEEVLRHLDRCHFLKMDCEGGEFDILLNANFKIFERIDRICLEYHDGFTEFSHTDLIKHLQQNGYRVKITPNPAHSFLGFLYAYRQ